LTAQELVRGREKRKTDTVRIRIRIRAFIECVFQSSPRAEVSPLESDNDFVGRDSARCRERAVEHKMREAT
jgi:hypothetical protein